MQFFTLKPKETSQFDFPFVKKSIIADFLEAFLTVLTHLHFQFLMLSIKQVNRLRKFTPGELASEDEKYEFAREGIPYGLHFYIFDPKILTYYVRLSLFFMCLKG